MTKDKAAILIKKSALVIEKLSNHILAPYDLTNTQYKILMVLFRNPGRPIRQADIETRLSMTNPSVTGIIQNLEKKELVQRIQNPNDKRSKLLSLTPKAIKMKEELFELGESLEKQATANLTEEETQQLTALLKKILAD